MKKQSQIKDFVANRHGFISYKDMLIKLSQSGKLVKLEDIQTEIVKEILLETLDAMIPEEVYIPKRFEGTNIVDAVEFGMKKQQLQERLVYLRMIRETQEGINL